MRDLFRAPGVPREMGIVLIERGSEVGGGEQRSAFGTVCRIIHSERLADGRYLAVAEGTLRRFKVRRWLPDDPYPLAEVDEIADDPWCSRWDEALRVAEREVRRAVALASELGESVAIGPLAADPVLACWQLCAAVPIGPFDRQRLLVAANTGERLALLADQARESASLLAFRLGQG
jgi:Lon protease-like protein